jgi:hypothetical protein
MPALSAYWPAEQWLHAKLFVAAVDGEYLPLAQLVQAVDATLSA